VPHLARAPLSPDLQFAWSTMPVEGSPRL